MFLCKCALLCPNYCISPAEGKTLCRDTGPWNTQVSLGQLENQRNHHIMDNPPAGSWERERGEALVHYSTWSLPPQLGRRKAWAAELLHQWRSAPADSRTEMKPFLWEQKGFGVAPQWSWMRSVLRPAALLVFLFYSQLLLKIFNFKILYYLWNILSIA